MGEVSPVCLFENPVGPNGAFDDPGDGFPFFDFSELDDAALVAVKVKG